jgi:hypothetical protein
MTGNQYLGRSESHGEYGRERDVSAVPKGGTPLTRFRQVVQPALGLVLELSAAVSRNESVRGATPMWYPSPLNKSAASLVRSGDASGENTPVAASVTREIVGEKVVTSAT